METTPATTPAPEKPHRVRKIRVFLTHRMPHLDEIFVWWALLYFRPEMCRKDIEFRCFEGTPEQLAELQKDEGVLFCGIGGGKLDEHPPVNGKGKEGECAASLALKELDLGGLQGLERLVRFIINQDVNGQGTPFDLAAGVRAIHLEHPQDPMKAIGWACLALEAFYEKEKKFAEALLEFHSKARVFEIPVGNNRKVKAATITTDNTAVQQCGRFIGISVLVQRQEAGTTQIYTDKRANLPPLDDVVRILRLWEMEAKRLPIPEWNNLADEGKVSGAEEWYYFKQGQTVLNGSLTTANTPSRLTLEQIRKALEIGLNSEMFESSRQTTCRAGNCTSTRGNPCPLYLSGLQRCRAIRFKQRHQAGATGK